MVRQQTVSSLRQDTKKQDGHILKPHQHGFTIRGEVVQLKGEEEPAKLARVSLILALAGSVASATTLGLLRPTPWLEKIDDTLVHFD